MENGRRSDEIEMERLLDENDSKLEEQQELKGDALDDEIDAFTGENGLGRNAASYRGPFRYSRFDVSSRLTSKQGLYIILTVNFLISLGVSVSSTTALDMQKKLVCTNWYAIYSPESAIPTEEKDPLCQTAEVKKWFSGLLVYMSLVDALGGKCHHLPIVCSHFVSRYDHLYLTRKTGRCIWPQTSAHHLIHWSNRNACSSPALVGGQPSMARASDPSHLDDIRVYCEFARCTPVDVDVHC